MGRVIHFPLLGEPLALDLANTRVRRDGAVVDLLATRAGLTAWLHAERRRLAPLTNPTEDDLVAVHDLRDAIDDLLRAQRAHRRPTLHALRAVNQALAIPRAPAKLSWTGAGPALAPPPICAQRDTLLHVLAADALAVLTGPQAKYLRKCAHPDCILQFIARNPRRRWCSSALCGNRARVARHYRQHCQIG